jgi:hypothetical protein
MTMVQFSRWAALEVLSAGSRARRADTVVGQIGLT